MHEHSSGFATDDLYEGRPMGKIAMTIGVLALAVTAPAGCTGSTEVAPSASADTARSPSASAQTPSTTPTLDLKPDVACDNGPNDSATGTAETDEGGVPIAYVLEASDTMWGIKNRFCLDDVAEPNGVNPGQIYPGDRLTLFHEAVMPQSLADALSRLSARLLLRASETTAKGKV